jgi:hypothetical protein
MNTVQDLHVFIIKSGVMFALFFSVMGIFLLFLGMVIIVCCLVHKFLP